MDSSLSPVSSPSSRSEIPVEDTWDLSLLFPDAAAWESAFQELTQRYPAYANYKDSMQKSAEALRDLLEFDKELDQLTERLYHFASLRASEDSSDDANLQRIGRLQNLLTRIGDLTSFFTPGIQAIDDDTFHAFMQDPALVEWKTKLRKIRRFKPHTLTQQEERLLALGAASTGAAREIFSQLTNVDMHFGTLRDEKGNEVELTHGSFSSFLNKQNRELRKNAFHQYYREFEEHKYTLAASLAGSVKADVFRARARNYQSAREAALFPDNVPVTVYNNLVSTVRDHLPALHRYLDLRKRLLGLDTLHHYDTYVPLVAEAQTVTSWDRAVDQIIASLAPLGTEYTSMLEQGLRGRWCDRYETKGKRSGAFSSSSYGNPPYILMNYKADVFSDVYTMAHEAGHSMHSWFAQNHQTFQDYDYPIFTAEVASTFNEELLTHHLLKNTTDRAMRAFLINRQIDDIRGTLFRQTMFAEFETIIHNIEESGESPTLSTLRSEYRKLLDAYFGPDFVIDEVLELECLRIPHFYSAFYVYKYATGISAAISLAHRVLSGGQKETEDYLAFLKSGGSREPLDTLKTAGVDMTSPQPISDALALFNRRVDELEELLA